MLIHWFVSISEHYSLIRIFESFRNSCGYFLLCQYLGFGSDSWVLGQAAQNETVAMLYTYCFYWSTLLLSTIGDVPLPVKRVEYVFVLVDSMIGKFQRGRTILSLFFSPCSIGILIFATIIGSLGTMISDQNQTSKSHFPL
jgi:cyclic nucleotide gated channel alpha 3